MREVQKYAIYKVYLSRDISTWCSLTLHQKIMV